MRCRVRAYVTGCVAEHSLALCSPRSGNGDVLRPMSANGAPSLPLPRLASHKCNLVRTRVRA